MNRWIGPGVCIASVLLASGCQKAEEAPVTYPAQPSSGERKIFPPRAGGPPLRLEGDDAKETSAEVEGKPSGFASGGGSTTVNPAMHTAGFGGPGRRVARSYEVAGHKVEIQGVCSYTQTDVDCWNIDGADHPELERTIREAIKEQKDYLPANVGIAPDFPNRKSRIVVFRLTNPASSSEQSDRVSLTLDANSARTPHFNLLRSMQRVGSSYSQDVAQLALGRKDETQTSLRFIQVGPEKQDALIECKLHATARLGNAKYQLMSMMSSTPRNNNGLAVSKEPVWTLKLRGFGPAENFVVSQFELLDAKGKRIPAIKAVVSSRDSMELIISVDPKKVSKLKFSGTLKRTIEIAGIPLDPR